MQDNSRPLHAGHSRMVGRIEVTPLWDGPLPTSLAKIPDPKHRAEAEALIARANRNALVLDVHAFLLRIGDRLALIDTGSGRLGNPDLGRLPGALATAGVTHDEIGTIFMTHAHRDHYGGLVDAQGACAFPNAELIFHEKEARFWLDSAFEDMPQRARSHYHPTREVLSRYADRLRRVTDGEDVFGISAVLAPGHTPGHTCWLIQSDGACMLAWGDLIHIAEMHLPSPHIAMEYDYDPDLALRSRLRMLDWVATDRIPIAGAHLPVPGMGTIVRSSGGYACEADQPASAKA
jgi:glyoxylase-like metal-dependent hydrolase (beta-lactamase superfamily II)